MSRSSDTQFFQNTPPADYGTVTLDSVGVALVTTKLTRVNSAIVTPKSGRLVASTINASAVVDNVVTITDSAGAGNAGATVYYIFFGF